MGLSKWTNGYGLWIEVNIKYTMFDHSPIQLKTVRLFMYGENTGIQIKSKI